MMFQWYLATLVAASGARLAAGCMGYPSESAGMKVVMTYTSGEDLLTSNALILYAIGLRVNELTYVDIMCTSLLEAVGENGLTSLAGAVADVLGEDAAAQLAPLAISAVELPVGDKMTLFAPSDAAFAAAENLPEGAELVELLLDHIVEGYFPSTAILENLDGQNLTSQGAVAKSLLGNQVQVFQDGETPAGIYVVGNGQSLPGSKVTTPDIDTCAGVVHIIDAVMLPNDPSAAVLPSEAPVLAEAPASEAPMAEGPITSEPRCKPGLFNDTDSSAGPSATVDADDTMVSSSDAPAPTEGGEEEGEEMGTEGGDTGTTDSTDSTAPADSETATTRDSDIVASDPAASGVSGLLVLSNGFLGVLGTLTAFWACEMLV